MGHLAKDISKQNVERSGIDSSLEEEVRRERAQGWSVAEAEPLPKSKELVSSSSSGRDSDSEVDKKLERKKQVSSGIPIKKAKDW